MSTTSEGRAESLFYGAFELLRSERDGFLDDACGTDVNLRTEVEELLRMHDGAAGFLREDAPASPGLEAEFGRLKQEQAGERIGNYRLLEQIGEGGFGVVWVAEQEKPVRRRVALKIIKPGMDTKEVIARFEQERQALAMMDHPNIAKILDAGATGSDGTESQISNLRSQIPKGRPYFVMELVRGIKITKYCDQANLPTAERLKLFIAVCHAVQHAHQKGIIHRDLKPSNILVTLHDGVPVPKVIDFGIAKATQQQRLTDLTIYTQFEQMVGTPLYMSPEQAEMSGLDIDTRSDIYSLGVLLYELLVGRTPFDPETLMKQGLDEIRRVVREQEPQKPSTFVSTMAVDMRTNLAQHRQTDSTKLIGQIRGDLDWIVMKALEKDRARRYETANNLAQDIQRHLSSEPVEARQPTAGYRFRRMVRRNKVAFAAAGAVLTALLAGLSVSTWMFFKEREARDGERRAREQAVAAEKAQSEERKKSEMEAHRSRQVADFLKDMLKGVGPSVAMGDDTKMLRKILDRTAERIGEALKVQPDVEADLRNIIGNVYMDLGEHGKAAAMHAEMLAIRRKHFGNEHPLVVNALNNLAGDLANQGKLNEAESLYREALAMERNLPGHVPSDQATALHNLAGVLREQGKLTEAETLHREALDMGKTRRGNEHPDVATSLNDLGVTLLDLGKPIEAESVLREGLAMRRKLFGDEHPDIATSLNNLSIALSDQKKLAEAETVQREALTMKRKLLKNDHPEVATALVNLANLLRRQVKLAEAESMYREALAMHRKFLRNDHRDVSTSLNGLALALHEQGKGAEAEILLREAEAILRKAFDNEHPDLARLIDNLGSIMRGQRKYSQSETLHREALAMSRKLLGNWHPSVAASFDNLAGVLKIQGKVAELGALFRDDIAMIRPSAGTDQPRFERRLYSFANTLYLQSEYAGAEPFYRELIGSVRARLGAEHEEVLGPVSSLARLLADWAWAERVPMADVHTTKSEIAERAREAERLLRDCLAILLRDTNATPWRIADVRSRLGAALVAVAVTDPVLTGEARLAKFAEAEPLLLEGNEVLQQSDASGSKYKRDALTRLTRLTRLYGAWEKPDKATKWQLKLDEFNKAEAKSGGGTMTDSPKQ